MTAIAEIPSTLCAGGGPLTAEKVYPDCCDFCARVDDSKAEVEVCDTMTQRCKGDTCTTCPLCKRFVAGLAFTEAQGWEISQEYDRKSGADPNRPALRQLEKGMEKGKVDAVLVVRLDRIMRSIPNFVAFLSTLELDRYGNPRAKPVTLIAIDQSLDTSTPAGRLMRTIIMAVAEYEKDIIRDHVLDGLAEGQERRQGARPTKVEGRPHRLPRSTQGHRQRQGRGQGDRCAPTPPFGSASRPKSRNPDKCPMRKWGVRFAYKLPPSKREVRERAFSILVERAQSAQDRIESIESAELSRPDRGSSSFKGLHRRLDDRWEPRLAAGLRYLR